MGLDEALQACFGDRSSLIHCMSIENVVQPVLKAAGLACRRGNELLFHGLTFAIHTGQLIWLRGHNGSGKTSLLRILVGLTAPHEGRIERYSLFDKALRVVYLGHTNSLNEQLTVFEALQFVAKLQGGLNDAISVDAALKAVSMEHRRDVQIRALSQGQRRRVALARLLLEHEPSLWVLDEPFDALDQAGVRVVYSLIQQHRSRGGAVLLTSHLTLDAKQAQADILDLEQMVSHA